MAAVTTLDELRSIYGVPAPPSIVKETNSITPHYRAYIEASPFAVLATSGPAGLDCSPRGGERGFIRVQDARTLLLPDRRGNNRLDSLSNIVTDPRVALLFMIPGVDITLRVNGQARISTGDALLESFAIDGKAPRTVVTISVDAVYFQCTRALARSELWNAARHMDPSNLPSAGQMLGALSKNRIDGDKHDARWRQMPLD